MSVFALVCAAVVAGCGSAPGRPAAAHPPSGSATGASGSAAPASGPCHYSPTGHAARKVTMPSSKPSAHGTVRLTIRTNRGRIPVALDAKSSPCTVNSFLALAHQGYFDHTPCHRLTTAGIYVLQCGDPTGTGTGGPGYTIPGELPSPNPHLAQCRQGPDGPMCIYPAGTMAMANTGSPNSGGSQFFLVYKDSPLPPTYAVFGKMRPGGVSVVRQIAARGSTPPNDGAPVEKVTITGVS